MLFSFPSGRATLFWSAPTKGLSLPRGERKSRSLIQRRSKQEVRSKGQETKGKKTKKLPLSELRRRQRLVIRILETRKAFEKLPITADEAYRLSREELERRPLRRK